MKKISIITISYNEVKTIEKTILSCINQTYLNQEYIIIDGASNDGTTDIINKYNEEIDVFISEPDKGLYDAMNKGLSLSTGDYVIFINSGDSLFNKHTLTSIFEDVKTKESDFIYGNAVVKQHNSNDVNYKKARNHKYSWYGMFTNHQAMIYSLKIIKENNLSFDQHNYPISADYKFTIEFLSKASNIQYIDNWICLFNLDGVSSVNKKQGLAEANKIRKEILNYNSFKIWMIEKLITSSHFIAENLKPVYNLMRFQSLKVQ